jgi:hypothetical protein
MRGSIFYLLVTVVLVLGLTSDSSEFQRHQRIVRGGSSGYFPQDRLSHLDPAYPGFSKFEYELSLAARKELREALGYAP